MTKAQPASAVSPKADADPTPPRGLSKSEKGAFRRVCALRRAAGRPVEAIEGDTVADYIAARSRLAELEACKSDSLFSKDRLSLAAAIDRGAAACRRLAHDLKLTGA